MSKNKSITVTLQTDPSPFTIGSKHICIKPEDDSLYDVEILEKRKHPTTGEWKFYVHYLEFNRRLDEWVPLSRLLPKGDDRAEYYQQGKKRKAEEIELEKQVHSGMDMQSLREHEKITKVKNVTAIELGRHYIEAWYFSPIPKQYNGLDVIYICEFCLKFFSSKAMLNRHATKCDILTPPGDEIYRNGEISAFEVDGAKKKRYCQDLCYIAKLFLDHKLLYYDVDPFLFYIMCEVTSHGAHIVGFFSKEKDSEDGFNLACICALPPYQRKGYGKFLIQLSYELSKKEQKVGTPEKPLSDMGMVSYRGYWSRTLLTVLRNFTGNEISIDQLSKMTCITTFDIITTLQHLKLIRYLKSQQILLIPDATIDRLLKESGSSGLVCDPTKIHWTPLKIENSKHPGQIQPS